MARLWEWGRGGAGECQTAFIESRLPPCWSLTPAHPFDLSHADPSVCGHAMMEPTGRGNPDNGWCAGNWRRRKKSKMNEQRLRVENLKNLRSARKNAGHHSNLNRLPCSAMMLQQRCDLKESLVFHRFDPRSKVEQELQLREKVNYMLCGMANKLSCIAAAFHQEWKKLKLWAPFNTVNPHHGNFIYKYNGQYSCGFCCNHACWK